MALSDVAVGRLIPMHCSAANDAFRTTHLCEAVTADEREYIRSRSIEGGLIQGLDGGTSITLS